jgi:hypothetical protein
MKAKDLRIGSTILFDGKITHASTRTIAYINNSERLKNGDSICFEPIPLTEEWLLRFGFTHDIEYDQFHFDFITITLPDCKVWVAMEYDIATVKSVHELENLYFALTGSELTFSNNA